MDWWSSIQTVQAIEGFGPESVGRAIEGYGLEIAQYRQDLPLSVKISASFAPI